MAGEAGGEAGEAGGVAGEAGGGAGRGRVVRQRAGVPQAGGVGDARRGGGEQATMRRVRCRPRQESTSMLIALYMHVHM